MVRLPRGRNFMSPGWSNRFFGKAGGSEKQGNTLLAYTQIVSSARIRSGDLIQIGYGPHRKPNNNVTLFVSFSAKEGERSML
jgi:hypothetical protein